MLLTKENFLQKIQPLKLVVDLNDETISYSDVIYGNDPTLVYYINQRFDSEIIWLSQDYTDITTLFVIFSINCKASYLTFDFSSLSCEWSVHDQTGNEIDSHFSYKIIGDGFRYTLSNEDIKGKEYEILGSRLLHFIEPEGKIKIPFLFIPKRFKYNLGYLAVQETEAIFDPNKITNNTFLFLSPKSDIVTAISAPCELVDKRKVSSIEENVMLFNFWKTEFNFPILYNGGLKLHGTD